MLTIVIVEDNLATRDMLKNYLSAKGHSVYVSATARGFKVLLNQLGHRIDIVLLDLKLPDANGINMIETVRRQRHLGLMVVSACQQKETRIEGLSLGADDYITKPFDLEELHARILSVAKRLNPDRSEVIAFQGWQADLGSRNAITPGQDHIALTKKEFSLYSYFLRRPRKAIKREVLLQQIDPAQETSLRSIDSLIVRLRKKLGDMEKPARLIQTIHGEGYFFSGDALGEGCQA